MGYTHYWRWKATPTAKSLQTAALAMRRILEVAGVPLADYTGAKGTLPAVGQRAVSFNGVGDDMGESFSFPGNLRSGGRPEGFNFVKTNRQPYDVAVAACLLAAARTWGPRTLQVGSDGRREDWEAAVALHQRAFPGITLEKALKQTPWHVDDPKDEPAYRLQALLDNPTRGTWDSAHSLTINTTVGWSYHPMTLWQAVRYIDPSFPSSAPCAGTLKDRWPRVPSLAVIREALRTYGTPLVLDELTLSRP